MDDGPAKAASTRADEAGTPGTLARYRLYLGAAAILNLCAALMLTLIFTPAPLLLWNASPSTRIGLYAIGRSGGLRVGDTVVAWPPAAARHLAAVRHYLPSSVPLVKRVAATAGARVCARGRMIMIEGRLAALRRPADPSGRRLTWWSGCRRLKPGELFLLSRAGPLAFDGRYFGITHAPEIIGRARLLWAKRVEGYSNG